MASTTLILVSTHSRPKAADDGLVSRLGRAWVSTHSRPKAAAEILAFFVYSPKFQHTAARRRLAAQTAIGGHAASFNTQPPEGGCVIFRDINAKADVSTHSRPKAAERRERENVRSATFQHTAARRRLVFNQHVTDTFFVFQHTAARRRLLHARLFLTDTFQFQHTAARRRLHTF